jgi:hypothetical protein
MTKQIRAYAPVTVDRFQFPKYRLVSITVHEDGQLFAHFADGAVRASCYATEADLLKASASDYLERVRLIR